MNPAVLSEALALVARAKANGHTGSVEDAAEWEHLNSDLDCIIPAWYIELITSAPLVGLMFGWQSSKPQGEDDGVSWVEWHDAANVRLESLESYPGVPLLEQGYVCVAGCGSGTGDQYFISVRNGEDPAFYQMDHEAKGDVLMQGREMVAPSLSEFFRTAKVEAQPRYGTSSGFNMK